MKKSGFTLLEIMIVTAVIGLLATLASIAVVKTINSSRVKQASGELEIIAVAIEQLAWDSGKWPNRAVRTQPGTVEIWDLSRPRNGLLNTDGTFKDWKGPYYDGVLVDPWGNAYFFDPDYRVDGVNHIAVGSFGPNGEGRNRYDDDDLYVLLDN